MEQRQSPKQYLEAASAPDADPADLRQLATAQWEFVREAVARDRNTPPEILRSLLHVDPLEAGEYAIAVAIAAREDAPRRLLAQLALVLTPLLAEPRSHSLPFEAAILLADNVNAPLDSLERMLRPNWLSRELGKKIAMKTTRRDVLELMARDRREAVRAIAIHRLSDRPAT